MKNKKIWFWSCVLIVLVVGVGFGVGLFGSRRMRYKRVSLDRLRINMGEEAVVPREFPEGSDPKCSVIFPELPGGDDNDFNKKFYPENLWKVLDEAEEAQAENAGVRLSLESRGLSYNTIGAIAPTAYHNFDYNYFGVNRHAIGYLIVADGRRNERITLAARKPAVPEPENLADRVYYLELPNAVSYRTLRVTYYIDGDLYLVFRKDKCVYWMQVGGYKSEEAKRHIEALLENFV